MVGGRCDITLSSHYAWRLPPHTRRWELICTLHTECVNISSIAEGYEARSARQDVHLSPLPSPFFNGTCRIRPTLFSAEHRFWPSKMPFLGAIGGREATGAEKKTPLCDEVLNASAVRNRYFAVTFGRFPRTSDLYCCSARAACITAS